MVLWVGDKVGRGHRLGSVVWKFFSNFNDCGILELRLQAPDLPWEEVRRLAVLSTPSACSVQIPAGINGKG